MGVLENPYNRKPGYACKFVYQNFNLGEFTFVLNPCCYMYSVPGYERMVYDGVGDFFEIWNSPALVEVRRRLKDGPLFSHCMKCPPKL